MTTVTKFIVKCKGSTSDVYWLSAGKGVTIDRKEAYIYTRSELKNHLARHEFRFANTVLIPVQVEE